jgi:uncharacterized membrane protein YfcA
MTHVTLLVLVGFVGGTLGSMVGLGGGIFIIPALVLFLDVPVHNAIAASLIAVVATSTAAAAAYLKDDLTNLRLGMTLETLTASGALAGGLVGTSLSKGPLSLIFGVVMVVVAVYMAVRQKMMKASVVQAGQTGMLGDTYHDRATDETVMYRPRHLPAGLAASVVAGWVSGLLGVGGGFLKVPVMVVGMNVPVRAAVATSSFMVGMTASVGALVYITRGLVDPVVTVPVVLGVAVGAFLGARLAMRVKSSILTIVLAIVLFALAIQMILSVAGISVR